MSKNWNLVLLASVSLALFACSSDSESSGKGSNEPCAANAECASGICAVVTGGNRCAPASNACTPACADGRQCADVGNGMGLCLDTVSGEDNEGGAVGEDNEGGAAGDANTGGGNPTGIPGGSGEGDSDVPGGSSTPPADPGVAACDALLGCFDTCADNDQNCVSACFDSNPEGGALYQAIIGCAQAAGCVGLDNSIDQECLNQECMPELEACFGPQAQPMGTLTCDEFLACANGCPTGDDQCQFDCVESSSQEGIDTYNAIISCLQDNDCFGPDGSADTACLEANCQTEYDACFGPPAMPMGTASCDEFVSCFQNCPDGDRDCVNTCIENTSPDAYAEYEAVIECGQTNMCFDDAGAGDQACLLDNCAEEMAPCFATPMGDGDCIALTTCLEGAADGAAEIACIEASSRAGYDDLTALQECVASSMCMDASCVNMSCTAEVAACYADGMFPEPEMP